MQLTYQKFDLPLRHVFTISRGSVAVQETFIVQLAADGQFGYGEATTNSFYGATIANMSAAIESVRPLVESAALTDPLELIASLAEALPKEKYAKFALNALDQAIHDLWGKLRGAPVYRLWGLSTEKVPLSDYTLGIDTPEKMVAKLKEMPGWPVYKIKLGTADDLEIAVSRRCELRLDGGADDRVRAIAEEAGRRIHRAAAAAGRCGRRAACVREFRVAAHRGRELRYGGGCRPLRPLFSRHQYQAGEVRRAGRGAADGRPSTRIGVESHGRLHD